MKTSAFVISTCIVLLCFVGLSKSEINSHLYDFEIDSEGHVLEGYLFPDVEEGDKVKVSLNNGEQFLEDGQEVQHIRLIVRKQNKNVTYPMSYVIVDTEAFRVDRDHYIVVNSTEEFSLEKEIRFYVVIIDNKGEVKSNPIPFVVRIEKKTESTQYYLHSAIFAGVLVLIIVVLALGIPFVVRAKRRYKQGKPVMKLGSHPGSKANLQSESTENLSYMKRENSEPNWYGENSVFNYENEVIKEKDEFTRSIKKLERTRSESESKKDSRDNEDGLVKYSKKGILKNGESDHNDGHISFTADIHSREEKSHL